MPNARNKLDRPSRWCEGKLMKERMQAKVVRRGRGTDAMPFRESCSSREKGQGKQGKMLLIDLYRKLFFLFPSFKDIDKIQQIYSMKIQQELSRIVERRAIPSRLRYFRLRCFSWHVNEQRVASVRVNASTSYATLGAYWRFSATLLLPPRRAAPAKNKSTSSLVFFSSFPLFSFSPQRI